VKSKTRSRLDSSGQSSASDFSVRETKNGATDGPFTPAPGRGWRAATIPSQSHRNSRSSPCGRRRRCALFNLLDERLALLAKRLIPGRRGRPGRRRRIGSGVMSLAGFKAGGGTNGLIAALNILDDLKRR
jgi:hypothetical protein